MDAINPGHTVCRSAMRRCAVVSAAVLLAYGRVLSGAWPVRTRRSCVVWAGAVSGSAAERPQSASAPRPGGSVLHHASGSVAAAAVLVQQARRVNLSRLGGLQGP